MLLSEENKSACVEKKRAMVKNVLFEGLLLHGKSRGEQAVCVFLLAHAACACVA